MRMRRKESKITKGRINKLTKVTNKMILMRSLTTNYK